MLLGTAALSSVESGEGNMVTPTEDDAGVGEGRGDPEGGTGGPGGDGDEGERCFSSQAVTASGSSSCIRCRAGEAACRERACRQPQRRRAPDEGGKAKRERKSDALLDPLPLSTLCSTFLDHSSVSMSPWKERRSSPVVGAAKRRRISRRSLLRSLSTVRATICSGERPELAAYREVDRVSSLRKSKTAERSGRTCATDTADAANSVEHPLGVHRAQAVDDGRGIEGLAGGSELVDEALRRAAG